MTKAWDHPTHLQTHTNRVSDKGSSGSCRAQEAFSLFPLRQVSKAALPCRGAHPSPSAEHGRGRLYP